LQTELKSLKEAVDTGKRDKQKKNWELQQLDIEIKDLIEKVGKGYILESVAPYQQEQLRAVQTQLAALTA